MQEEIKDLMELSDVKVDGLFRSDQVMKKEEDKFSDVEMKDES